MYIPLLCNSQFSESTVYTNKLVWISMFMYVNTYPFVKSGRVEQHERDPVQAQAKKGG
jgi:hypothetical protein